MNYYLMNKNRKVLLFSYDEETHTILKILKVLESDYAPLGIKDYKMGVSRKLFNDWWRNRAIPASRSNFREILEHLNISTSVELLERCYGLSLSDQYWVMPEKSQIQWKDINFFENSFSEDIGQILMGGTVSNKIDMFSPDNSSDGNLKKKWKIIDGKRCLIKSGNTFNNQEPFNEVVDTALYKRLLNREEYVPYRLIQENGRYFSCCETMVNTDEELVSAYYIDQQDKLRGSESLYEHYIRVCESLEIPNIRQKVDKMIVCDYILANYDRHYRNFGAIRNVETLIWERVAPIFDSGSSLYAKSSDMEIGFSYTSRTFKGNPEDQLLLVKDLSWFDERKLIGFEDELRGIFSKNTLISKERIEKLAEEVNKNIAKVIALKQSLVLESETLKEEEELELQP